MAGIVVAIDGPSGSGKSSTSKAIAIRANWNYLDTGALYRAATWIALNKGVSEGWEIISAIKEQPIVFSSDPKNPKIFCGDVDVTDEIRGVRVTDNVSRISQIAELRSYLVDMQQTIISKSENGIVVEGRDIGTVVFPSAALKIFVTADPAIRVERRFLELQLTNPAISKEEIAANLQHRDLLDTTRERSPLRQAADAKVLDNSTMNREEQFELALQWALTKISETNS